MIERRIAWPLLCAFVFSIPWEKSLVVPEIGTVTRLLGLLAFAAGVAVALRRRPLRAPNLALIAASTFAAWEVLTYFWSIAPAESAGRALTFAQLAFMLWLIWEFCRTPGSRRP